MLRTLTIMAALAAILAACATGEPAVPDHTDDVRFSGSRQGDVADDGEHSPSQDAGFFFQDMPPSGPISFRRLGLNSQGYLELERTIDRAIMVVIPGGYFHKRAYWDTPGTLEREEGSWVNLPPLLFDKHEVTNAQVMRFLNQAEGVTFEKGKATGPDGKPYAIDHYWGLRITERGADIQRGYARHPAVGCSGWLALAYAKWVGGDLPRGTEYEKAAAGPAGLLFPWGDELPDSTRANSCLHGPKQTMPVGSYPRGASPYGLHEMAGNVYDRAYWDGDLSTDPDLDLGLPTMLKGGGWVSPNWWNLRCVCRCGQPMDAMEGSVGFRVVVRDPAIVNMLAPPPSMLRVFTNTYDAYAEAGHRNVPILLYMGYERCGQCDRVQAQLFTDPAFVEYCNENIVVLIAHSTRAFNDLPKTPIDDKGIFFAHTGARLAEMQEVWDDFSIMRTTRYVPLPDSVPLFVISPGLFLLNPHRHDVRDPQDAVLIGEEAFMGHKGGGDRDVFLRLFKEAQEKLGQGQSLADYQADQPSPETTWQPTPEDAAMWERAKRNMDLIAKALRKHKADYEEYPESVDELREYFTRGWLPQDPFAGDYFRYKRTEEGFELTCYGAGDIPGGEETPDKDIVINE